MNGSRSSTPRHGERSSLDALNRTIEGLEARIEGLMAGAARSARPAKTADLHEPVSEQRHAASTQPAAAPRDPLAEIRERQRMLSAGRERPLRNEQEPRHEVRAPEAPKAYTPPRPAMPAPRRELSPRPPVHQPRMPAQQTDASAREIAEALVNLRQELKQDISEGVAREIIALRGEIRSIKSIAEDQRFVDDLRGDLARLAEGIDLLGHQAMPETDGLRAEFEELRSVIDGLAREDSFRQMEHRWQGLEARIQEMDSNTFREELAALAYRIDDVKGQIGAMNDSPVIRALEQKLISVATAMEQLGSRMQPNDGVISEQFTVLDERLDEITRAIAASSRAAAANSVDQAFMQRLEGRIGALSDQIDTISQVVQTQIDPTEALSHRIEALTGRIEELTDEQATLRLEERLEQLSLILDKASNPDQIADLTGYLSDISRKIDSLQQGALNHDLTERLDYLARRIDDMDHAPRHALAGDQNAFGRLEDRLSDIASRLDEAAAAPRNDETALRGLEDQIAHLSVLIAQPQQTLGGLPADFDNRMAAIESYMSTNDEYIIEAARQAAEAVVDAYSRNAAAGAPMGTTDIAALAALADDLRNLEELTRGSEDRTHQTFEALHNTLVQIADRLDAMEDRLLSASYVETMPPQADYRETARAAAMPAAAPLSVRAVNEPVYADEPVAATFGTREALPESTESALTPSIPEAIEAPAKPAKTSLLGQISRRLRSGTKVDEPKADRTMVDPAPSIDPTDALPSEHEHELIEPGSGAPDVKKILERVRASQAAGEFDNARANGSDRADYIAAARRAAKAAAQEADPSQGKAPAKDLRKAAKPASGQSLWAKLSKHRRPILMAVGAVLLALMAVPLASKFIAGDAQTSSARIEAPAQPAATANIAGTSTETAPADSLLNEPKLATAPAAQAAPAQQPHTMNPLTDPRPADGQAAAMERSIPAQQMREQLDTAPKAEASAPIVVPAGIEPKSLATAASAGDANALFEIGARFTDGRGVKSDPSEAANWYKLAADRGLAPAQYRLANLFEKGTGVNRDIERAIGYYKQAADAGNASSMHNLAVLYASGANGQPDYATAVSWFAKAADHGVADSQFNLAILYARGNGVKQNLEESYKWFAIAAKDGDKDAAQKRDEVAGAMRKEQVESARAKVDAWKVQPLDPKANAVNLPEDWASGKPLTTASVDMEKAIRNIQAILNKNGFDAGSPDGKIGAKTVSAIKSFQTSVGQEPTGKINDALVKELLARNK